MPIYWIKALTRDPKSGQVLNVPAGSRDSIVVNFPGSLDQFRAWAKQNSLGSQYVRYAIVQLQNNMPETMVLSVQLAMGATGNPSASAPSLSGEHVNGGQPTGMPTGNPNQGRGAGTRDNSSGFQTLGDADLGGAGEAMFGSPDDGTVSDLIAGGFGSQEIPRQI